MMIYGEIDNRLESAVTFDPYPVGNSYLLVVHPNNTDRWIKQELDERLAHPYCKGVLLVKGVPMAGISDGYFDKLKKQYGDRFHISACAVGTLQESTRLSGELQVRFKKFFEHVRGSDDKINWSILDPQWPCNLFPAYLLAKVVSTNTQEANLIESQSADWEPIWEAAKKEYELLTDKSLTSARLDKNTAGDVAEQIGQYLEKIAARVS
jgi:hypothetical protein